MASNVWVISSELKRTQIKVTPGTYLSDVLIEACQKLRLNSDRYQLRHNQKLVDLSVAFRQSKLPGGAKLELVVKSKTPSAITVAVQLPQPEAKEFPGGRIIAKFPTDISLWQVLRQLEDGPASQGRNINVTSRGTAGNVSSGAGQLFYETPVLNIMGRELSTFGDFQKTLSQLGYNSGSVLMRLTFKVTDTPLFQAMEKINEKFKQAAIEELEADKETAAKAAKQQPEPVTTALEQSTPVDVSQQTPSEQPDSSIDSATSEPTPTQSPPADPLQPVTIFAAPANNTPMSAQVPFNESDYVPTIAQLQAHQANLSSRTQNKRLLSDEELAAEAARKTAKLASVKSLITKVRFPDNTSAQWNWGPGSTGALFYTAIRQQMADPTLKFRLALLPGRQMIADDERRLIQDYKLSGGVMVTLLWDESVGKDARAKAFLNAEAAKNAKEIVVPVAKDIVEEKAETKAEPAPELKKTGGGGVKVPKWFKMGKK